MATDREFIDYILEQAGLGERLTVRRMFGEYALYLDGKVIGFACDNSLFAKPTAAAERLAPNAPWRPPYPEAKPYPVLDELLDDGDALRALLQESARLLPEPKPKPSPTARASKAKAKPGTPKQAPRAGPRPRRPG